MRDGRNPTRRNRNIGTAKQGHGRDNRMVVPRSWRESVIQWARNPDHWINLIPRVTTPAASQS